MSRDTFLHHLRRSCGVKENECIRTAYTESSLPKSVQPLPVDFLSQPVNTLPAHSFLQNELQHAHTNLFPQLLQRIEMYMRNPNTALCLSISEINSQILELIRENVSHTHSNSLEAQLFNLLGIEGIELMTWILEHANTLSTQIAHTETNTPSQSHLIHEFGLLENGYDTSGPAGLLRSDTKLLPQNTLRIQHKWYEIVHIPAPKTKSIENESNIPIAELEPFAQTAFNGMMFLNRLQSKLFCSAYQSNQNLLICAPTGAGKTNVAMLTILQEIKTQLSAAQRQLAAPFPEKMDVKIIYVAPMKALAQEVVSKFQKRLKRLGLCAAELTGDMQLSKQQIEKTHVIVTTPEKWDVITRKSSTQQALLRQVKLLIIDEVHLLADARGPVIETIVARTLRRVEATQSMIRIVGLSATLPNYVDVARFLRAHVPSVYASHQAQERERLENAAVNGGKGGLYYFDASYRPVPLDQTFIGINTTAPMLKEALQSANSGTSEPETDPKKKKSKDPKENTMSRTRQIQQVMNLMTFRHCLAQMDKKEQLMIFVHSRKETANTIRAIIELCSSYASEKDENASFFKAPQRLSNYLEAFLPPLQEPTLPLTLQERLNRSRNRELKEFVPMGFGIHHAGMLRSDRNLCEELFEKGYIRVLCCTATLAWGVNLPAHSVLIKGTQVYNAERGGLTQLSMLDILQIFGRAGRPQYDTHGEAVLLTTLDQIPHYMRLIASGVPMESALIKSLSDHLNAEIVSGTVSNLQEACEWLSYTYLFVRMRKNPIAYGFPYDIAHKDANLIEKRRQILMDAAKRLEQCRMIKILYPKGIIASTDSDIETRFAITALGRVASHYYISYESIATFNELFQSQLFEQKHRSIQDLREQSLDYEEDDRFLSWNKAILVLCSSKEFEQLKMREDEMTELENLEKRYCRYDVTGTGGLATSAGKTSVLLQALLARARVSNFTLISDTNYVAQNASRVCRALFELCRKEHNSSRALTFLQLAKAIDQKVWMDQTPLLSQFSIVPADVIAPLRDALYGKDEYAMLMDGSAFGASLSVKCRKFVSALPFVQVAAEKVQLQLTSGQLLRMQLFLVPLFQTWNGKLYASDNGSCSVLRYWVWVEDAVSGYIYHSETITLHQETFQLYVQNGNMEAIMSVSMHLPVFFSKDDENAAYYVVRVLSDQFVGVETFHEITYRAESAKAIDHAYTKLYEPLHALCVEKSLLYGTVPTSPAAILCRTNPFPRTLNSMQLQVFHTLYHQRSNVLLCAPAGSGKTFCAELAMLQSWNVQKEASNRLILYVAPLSSIAVSIAKHWKRVYGAQRRVWYVDPEQKRFEWKLLLSTLYSADAPSIYVLSAAELDEIMRQPQLLHHLNKLLALIIVDQLHFLMDPSIGPRFEAVISRLKWYNNAFEADMRARWIVLSAPLENAMSVAQWLGIPKTSVFDYTHEMTNVQLHVQGYPERSYVSRMSAMNKPIYMAIQTYTKANDRVLIFVSSRAQAKQTAMDLISYCVSNSAATHASQGFLHVSVDQLDQELQYHQHNSRQKSMDGTLQHTMQFGIGLYHNGLRKTDRDLVLRLYAKGVVRVQIVTIDKLWQWESDVKEYAEMYEDTARGDLVIVKGTEAFHSQNAQYEAYSWTQMTQLLGLAKPFSVVCVLVAESQKNMMQRLLQQPITLESELYHASRNNTDSFENLMLLPQLFCHISDEGMSIQEIISQSIAQTFFFHRLREHSAYYGIEKEETTAQCDKCIETLVKKAILHAVSCQCIAIRQEKAGKSQAVKLFATQLTRIAVQNIFSSQMLDHMRHNIKKRIACGLKENMEEVNAETLVTLCEIAKNELRSIFPVRHYESQIDFLQLQCQQIRFSNQRLGQNADKHVHKAFVLIQAHIQRISLPNSELTRDSDALIYRFFARYLHLYIQLCLSRSYALAQSGFWLLHCLQQRQWIDLEHDNGAILAQLSFITLQTAQKAWNSLPYRTLSEFQTAAKERNVDMRKILGDDIVNSLSTLPNVEFKVLVADEERLEMCVNVMNALSEAKHSSANGFYIVLFGDNCAVHHMRVTPHSDTISATVKYKYSQRGERYRSWKCVVLSEVYDALEWEFVILQSI